MSIRSILAWLLLFYTPALLAQKGSVKGRITASDGKPLSYITVGVKQTASGAQTDENGNYIIQQIAPGKYTLSASAVGYKPAEKVISITGGSTITADFLLQTTSTTLEEVAVQGYKSGGQIRSQTISTAAYKEQPATLVELMNRAAGIRIRQTGGLGSRSNLMLNGFQNRSVRYFKDGIPLDYLGGGFDISLVPSNMLDRVEVYKGVLPFHLGADALGGAINMITAQDTKSFLNASFEHGSFNTNRVSLNGYYKNASGKFFAGVNAFYNYADNNYKVNVQQVDTATGNKKDAAVKLFHNRFSNYYAEGFIGIAGRKWADELRFGLTAFSVERQFQFGSTMDKPFGAATGKQYSVVPTLQYKKQLWQGKLDINQFLVYNSLHAKTVDTAHGHYDWYGHFSPSSNSIGEISDRGSLSDITFKYFTSRTNLSYKLTPGQVINVNVVFNNFSRTGEDPYGFKFKNEKDVLTVPAKYNKIIVAGGLTSTFLEGRLQNSLAGKFYHYNTDASDADYQGNEIRTKNSNTAWGIAEGIKYNITRYSSAQLSVETALRLPEQDELFGDGNLKLSNFDLHPERSLNINAGYKIAVPGRFKIEANAFYRYTKDLILLMPINFMYAQSQNVEKVKGAGLDADASVNIFSWLEASGNFTYQDLRLVNPGNVATDKARLRNTPYFFANAGLNARFNKVLFKEDKIHLYWYYSFVREYYVDYIPKSVEPDGFLGLFGKTKIDARNVIPDQQVHTAGFTYYPDKNRYAIGFQTRNIFDTPVYDNFRIQNPGRSFSLKISYSL
ncbi:TonB-dependent receptor [Chitinophaga arvensicola]|uniref:Outer membrane receptor proteins, mostly Fe transport n=1 Tax=Chitinophaga arvensicola TaxID=29529 RepID=A0A1I0S9G3_9BACT|nr:TonB-dependent receptor [Chitinophaga arvensicola]SEW52866.1 Outer membrane receptor proteins, mostly Fe transport [Chitinophaga arvensicola]